MNIVLYDSFSKRENSTKRPPYGQQSIILSGELKQPCSMFNPVFSIKRLNPDDSPFTYTYSYMPDFGRYYFVKDWQWIEGLWQCTMEVDVLASFRTQIGSETHYVLRHNSTTDFNEYISDSVYPATNEFTVENTILPNDPFRDIFTSGVAGGIYVVGIISGNQNDAVGAITYYAMSSSQFGALKHILFGNENLRIMNIIDSSGTPLNDDLSPDVLKTLYNPYQYIASCMWFPFTASDIPDKTSVSTINIGWWSYNLSGYRIGAQVADFSDNVSLPSHPQASTRGAYLNYAPFTRRTLTGRFGDIPIDTSYFTESNQLGLEYYVDLISGQCKVFISYAVPASGGGYYYRRYTQREFLLGVPIQLAQIGVDYLGAGVTAIDTAAGVAGNMLSFNVTGAVSKLAHGVYDTLKATMPQMETGGSNGSFVGAYTATRIVSQFFHIVPEDVAHLGRPLYEIRQLNTLSGYILCADGEVSISCLAEERKLIENFLTSGFFWE